MKPLVTTARALRELATGSAASKNVSAARLRPSSDSKFDYLLAAKTKPDETKVIIYRNEPFEVAVPTRISAVKKQVASRMASFVDRAGTARSLNLPRGWHQYKHDNFISFYVAPNGGGGAERWVVELPSDNEQQIVFWHVSTTSSQVRLEDFATSARPTLRVDPDAWHTAIGTTDAISDQQSSSHTGDIEISLSPLTDTATRGWTYEEWMNSITEEQRRFVEAPTIHSLRLRGPAGSGKTLALTLKAAHEIREAATEGRDLRTLVVTHSWSLASEIATSLDHMGIDTTSGDTDVFPLVEIARSISPQYAVDSDAMKLMGEDSLSGKRAQLDEILDVIDDFVNSDWVTFRRRTSPDLAARFDSTDDEDRFDLAWDILGEFTTVIGASAIFPGAGQLTRYLQVARASWMMPLNSTDDQKVLFRLYELYMSGLERRGLWTTDQVLADLLSYLETHSWNRARRSRGYDLIFVDEFHLFSRLEDQVLHYLARDIDHYPHVFMALDPRQSPSETIMGTASERSYRPSLAESSVELGEIEDFSLSTVHRFSPEILGLVKHIHNEFPTLDLGQEWQIDFARVESSAESGPMPTVILAASRSSEENDIVRAIHDLYSRGRLAIAVVDQRQWPRYAHLAELLGNSGRFSVTAITGRSDIDTLSYSKLGVVVGPAEHMAGLQFDTVLVAGIPDVQSASPTPAERTRLLSHLYLAASRARSEVRIYVNEEDGGVPEVLQRAAENDVVIRERGSQV